MRDSVTVHYLYVFELEQSRAEGEIIRVAVPPFSTTLGLVRVVAVVVRAPG